jgi:hypothetical protein
LLQADYNKYEINCFEYIVLSWEWEQSIIRRGKELELIIQDRDLCYNIEETHVAKQILLGTSSHPETKKKISEALTGRPNTLLGRKISIKQIIYPSIAEVSSNRYSKKKQLKKVDDLAEPDYLAIVIWERSNDHPKRSRGKRHRKTRPYFLFLRKQK